MGCWAQLCFWQLTRCSAAVAVCVCVVIAHEIVFALMVNGLFARFYGTYSPALPKRDPYEQHCVTPRSSTLTS
jgi:hypothetical protein